MTRAELIGKLAAIHPQLTNKDIELAVRTILDTLTAKLAQGDRIELRGFGSFGLSYRPPRNGRNPKTGASVLVSAKYVPSFKPGKDLRVRVNGPLNKRLVMIGFMLLVGISSTHGFLL